MKTAVIIEDEIPAARGLQILLEKNGFEVLCILNSVKVAKQWFSTNDYPDFVFADISLNDGLSFEIFENKKILSALIFITAYNEYAINAFDYYSLDYVLKPITESKLQRIIEKAKILNKSISFDEVTTQNYKKEFIIYFSGNIVKIKVDKILFFYSENNATYCNLIDNRIYPIDDSLENIENNVNPNTYFRISRKYIINKNYINFVKGQHLTLIDCDINFKISRMRYKSFKDWFSK